MRIDSPQKLSGESERASWNTYKLLEQVAILLAGFAVIALSSSFLPRQAHAFWPFSTNADAQTNATVPASDTPALSAAINSDPNPDKGLSTIDSPDGTALYASSGPSGSLADVAGTSPAQISVYEVRAGDTLSEIAAMYGVSVNTIIWANDLKSASDVHPGDTLIILPVSGVERVVVKGDTLASVAKKYGADATEIAQYNGLDPEAPLAVGSTIIIPGGELAAPSAPAHSKGSGLASANPREPYLGGSGPAHADYYESPIPGGTLSQGLHGWNAVDIGAARGTPIHAAADGTVIIARNNGGWNGGYGNYVVITHANGTQTLYAHMAHAIVSPGQTVAQGQIIGYVGMTGETTGPHVHFEIRGAKNLFASTCAVGETIGAFSCE